MSLGWPQLLIVLLIVLVIFGAKRWPEIGRSLGGCMREFKDSVTAREGDDDDVVKDPQITRGDDTNTRV